MSVRASISSSNIKRTGDTFEIEVIYGESGHQGAIKNHMDVVRASSTIFTEVDSAMPAYWKGKSGGKIDAVAVSHDGKTVEIIEIKTRRGEINGQTGSVAAFEQAKGGAVAIQSGNGRKPVKGFRKFETYIITSIARDGRRDSVRSESYTAQEIAEMGRA